MVSGLILVAVFLTVVLTVWGVYALVVQTPLRAQRKVVSARVDALVRSKRGGARERSVELFKEEREAARPGLPGLLASLPRADRLQHALQQADWRISVGTFALLTLLAAGGVVLVAMVLWRSPLLAVVLAGLGACGPYLVLTYKRRKRLDTFLEQFPEAIDLLGRAVRAGHAITTGFEMVADEMDEPIGPEFRQTHDQQKFGLPMLQALTNLQERVPLLDVRLLATAIAIQREVGGNLAEVLDKIAHTIRERLKIHRQIKVYTAQGRLTGYILAALPIVLGMALFTINPDYFRILLEHPYGIFMIGFAALLQVLGYFWIRKIVHIKI